MSLNLYYNFEWFEFKAQTISVLKRPKNTNFNGFRKICQRQSKCVIIDVYKMLIQINRKRILDKNIFFRESRGFSRRFYKHLIIVASC